MTPPSAPSCSASPPCAGGALRAPAPAPLLPPSALLWLALFMGPSDAATALMPGCTLSSVHLYSGELTEAVVAALAHAAMPITFGGFTRALAAHGGPAAPPPSAHHDHPDEVSAPFPLPQVVQILSTLPDLATAEFRYAPRKDAKACKGGRARQITSRTDRESPARGELGPSYRGNQPVEHKLLETTQVSQSVIVLSLHYIFRLKERSDFTLGKPGSESRVAVCALMLANKFVD
ncbi:hypothetical protein DFH11DRAFT_1552083, partial [Phellopilus nigrolimitatus]